MVGVRAVKVGSRELIIIMDKIWASNEKANRTGWTVESWNRTDPSVMMDVSKAGSIISVR